MLKTAVSAIALLAVATLPALADDPLSAPTPKRTDTSAIIVGSADFPESQVLATIYADALKAKGLKVEERMNIGSREVYMPALIDGSIDLIPEYNGSVLSYLDKNSKASSTADVDAALKTALPKGISMLPSSAATDTDVVAVTAKTAAKYHLKTIADLAPVAGKLVLGGPPEWKTRQEGVVGLHDVYGLTFKSFKTLDVAGPLTLSALVNGQVQAADMTSTDPAMTEHHLVALEDNKNLFPSQNIVPLIATAKESPVVTETLNAISAALTTSDLIAMNAKLADHESYDAVAEAWLKAHHLD